MERSPPGKKIDSQQCFVEYSAMAISHTTLPQIDGGRRFLTVRSDMFMNCTHWVQILLLSLAERFQIIECETNARIEGRETSRATCGTAPSCNR
jgi:hypothetical protein